MSLEQLRGVRVYSGLYYERFPPKPPPSHRLRREVFKFLFDYPCYFYQSDTFYFVTTRNIKPPKNASGVGPLLVAQMLFENNAFMGAVEECLINEIFGSARFDPDSRSLEFLVYFKDELSCAVSAPLEPPPACLPLPMNQEYLEFRRGALYRLCTQEVHSEPILDLLKEEAVRGLFEQYQTSKSLIDIP